MTNDAAARIVFDEMMRSRSPDRAFDALVAAWPTITDQQVDHVIGIAAARLRAEGYRQQSMARTRRAANDN